MAEEGVFEQAVEALRQGDKARARELLTHLIKTEQTNATYWVWMSAAVDSAKERVYCLQTALKLDPANASAKRGLILSGALPPDENVTPFPVNRPRAWEQNLLLAHELPKPTGMKAVTSSPFVRLIAVGLAAVVLVGVVIVGLRFRPQIPLGLRLAFTPGPSPTFSPTPTLIGEAAAATPTFIGPTPLWAFLPATYTPTPLYVVTPRQPQSSEQFSIARNAYKKGDWEGFIQNMRVVATQEPESADVQYLLGEGYRFQGNRAEALAAYEEAIRLNDKFGPAYLGLARIRLMQDPNDDVTGLLDLAAQYDPAFGEIYLERANYDMYHGDAEAALADLDSARRVMPDSPLVYYGMALAHNLRGDTDAALENAEKAYELDITMLPVYLLRGELYIQQERFDDAVRVLNTYLNYEPKDGRALALLGECYYQTGDYENAIKFMSKGTQLDSRLYLHRAFAYLETDRPQDALVDFDRAIPRTGPTVEIKIGQVRANYALEKFGSAYLDAESAFSLAKNDTEKALALYWRALSNEGRSAISDAVKDWQALLKLPASAMTEEMRREADEHLRKIALITPSPTPKPVTPTRTPPPKTPTRTPTRTPTPKP